MNQEARDWSKVPESCRASAEKYGIYQDPECRDRFIYTRCGQTGGPFSRPVVVRFAGPGKPMIVEDEGEV